MKRTLCTITLFCALLLAGLLLFSCGGGGSATGSTAAAPSESPTGTGGEPDSRTTTGTGSQPEPTPVPDTGTETDTETESETKSEVTDIMIGETIDAPYADSFTVSNVFSSDMVVQRGEHIRVWGYADASENGHKVSGEFMGMFAEALIENGEWTLTFGARLNACADEGNSMRIYTDKTSCVFENVLVGDVFMVIGQSNVAHPMMAHRAYVNDPARGGVGYDDISLPIRLHYNSLSQNTGVTRGTGEVCAELHNGETWTRTDADPVARFSALGYMFAVEYTRATGVPVGIIEIDGNGQPIGSFMPNSAAEATGSDQWSDAKGYYVTPGCNGDAARYMYNHYMYPFEKYALAGLVWYQGESDCEAGLAEVFPDKLAALLTYMRTTHNLVNPDFPVYLIEFPPIFRQAPDAVIPAGQGWAFMDLGLVRGTLGSVTHRIPACYAVSSADLWTDRTFWNSLHPNCKFEQAQRAAGIAAAVSANGTPGAMSGPVLASAELSGDGKQVILTYTNVGTGLTTADGSSAVTGFSGLRLRRNGTLNLTKVLSAEITAPDRITVTFSSRVDGVGYHLVATQVYGEDINLTSSSDVPACADIWMFD